MHLTVVCPACQSQYQVDPGLLGKRMRCPNTICRTVFEVQGEADQEKEPSNAPVVAAPVVRPEAPVAAPKAPPNWSAPPPVRATSAAPVTALPPPEDFDIPGDIPVDDPPPLPHVERTPTTSKKRGPWLIVGGLVAVFALAAAAVVFQFAGRHRQLESALAAQADDVYQKGDFAEAMKRFQQLQRDFPNTADFDRYRFLATLSDSRAEVDAAHDPLALADARRHALEFLDANQDSPHFKTHQSEVFDTLLLLAKRSAQAAQENPDATLLTQVETLWRRARPLAARASADDDAYFRATFAEVRTTLARRALRQETLAALTRWLQTPTAVAIAEARHAIVTAALVDDAEVSGALKALRDAHKASIAFVPAGPSLPMPAADAFGFIPLVAPLQPVQLARGLDPVVALSPSGVCYALDARRGNLLWAHRLGIDSRFPPLRLNEGDTSPARFLVIANDQKTALLLDGLSGKPAWQHVLSAPAASEPIISPGHLLIPLVTGRIEDLNPATGALAGSFQFDQPLPYGGTHLPESSLVALPGEAHCVYILDLANRSCAHVIETGHAAGALVGPPIFIAEGGPRSWLILTEAEAGPRIKLRPIPYPPESAGKRHEPDFVVHGTLSFPPRHDAESILLATEEGRLHRVGLRLRGNTDPLLFPLTPADITLEALPTSQPMKAMVAHVDAENTWVMSAGRLQRVQQSFSHQKGPVAKVRWPKGTWLGEPLHGAHAHADAEGTILFLATHDPNGPAAWLSAVDGETGKILWKTQVGALPRGELLVAEQTCIWHDHRLAFLGPLSRLGSGEAPKTLPIPEMPHRTLLLKEPISARGPSVLIVGWAPGQATLSVTEIVTADGVALEPVAISLPAPVAAPPITGPDSLIVALTNGILCRVDLKTRTPRTGPDWRAAGAAAEARSHLVRVGPDRFVAADGAGGLVAFAGAEFLKDVARYRPGDRRLLDQTALITGEVPQLLAVDANGQLILLDAAKLQPISRKDWDLKGRVTAGPFIIGGKALVGVDGKRLVAIDPSRDGCLWDVAFLADIACAPVLAADRLVVADLNGNFWRLDPDTGANVGPNERPALSIRANLVPDVSPVVLPDGQLYILWSDGSAGVVALTK